MVQCCKNTLEAPSAQSTDTPANSTTLRHFSVSSTINLPNSAGVIGFGMPPSSANRATSFGSFKRFVDGLVEDVDNLRRRALRRGHARRTGSTSNPGTVSAIAGMSGRPGQRCGRGDAERAHVAGARLRQRGRQIVEDQLHLVGDDVGKGDRRSAIGHVHHVAFGHRLEQFGRHVHRGAVAGGGIGNLARIGLAVVDQLRKRSSPASRSTPPACWALA